MYEDTRGCLKGMSISIRGMRCMNSNMVDSIKKYKL